MKEFVKNLIEQHKFASEQLAKIEDCIESGNLIEGVSKGEVSLDEYSAIMYQNKVVEDYVAILAVRLKYNNVIITEDGEYFEKVEDKSKEDA